MFRDQVGSGNPLRRYDYDDHGRLATVTALVATKQRKRGARAGMKYDQKVWDRYLFGNDKRGRRVMLPTAHDTRELVCKPIQRTFLYYGNGRTMRATTSGGSPIPGNVAGPRGQLVLSEQFQGLDRSKDVQQNATFVSYSMLNQVQASTTREYSSGVRACTKGPRARNTKFSATTLSAMRGCPYGWLRAKATKAEKKLARTTQRGTRIVLVLEHAGSVSGEVAMYDPLGRQFQSVLTVDDDPRDGAQSISHVERRYFTGEAQDPFSEVALGGDGVGTRWVLRGPTGLIGELRDTQTRYSVTDQQGSPRLSLDGSSNSLLKATYDYDTFGSAYERDNELSLASGTADEFEQAAYGYTGMRQRDSAATTNHHARDYNADLRSWLQTDQYMDPWSDVGMPRVEWTRLISLSR